MFSQAKSVAFKIPSTSFTMADEISAQPISLGKTIGQEVDAERLALLYRLTPMTLATAVAFSLIVFAFLQPVVDSQRLVGWLIANNSISVIRYLDIQAYRRAAPVADIKHWHRRFILLTFCAGSVWGLMGTLLFPIGEYGYQAILIVFMVGTSAVGLFTLTSSLAAYCALALPILIPPAIFIYLQGDTGHLHFSSALLFFAFLVVINSRRSINNTTEMLTFRFENARIAKEREQALLAAEEAGRARLQFLANMSHEIRTPLNGILGMGQLLQNSPLDSVQKHRLETINTSGQHLLVLINDILDFSKMEAGKLEVAPQVFEFRRLPKEVLDLLVERAVEKDIVLKCQVSPDIPRWLLGDAGRVKQVLHNLVGNAIKFTDHGEVSLQITQVSQDAHQNQARIRFVVRDSGVGISDNDQKNLFQLFSQVDASATRKHGGTGLGLAISKQLVELMGGNIGCESQPGSGSTFWFELPFALAEAPVENEQGLATGTRQLFSARILLVEDNPTNSEVARIMLEDMGVITVIHAANGRAGLNAAKIGGFDLILMDCQMPEMDGFEATRQIIAHERSNGLPHTPIIALTANAIRGDRETCIEAGMDDYLAKPFRFEALMAKLDRWLPKDKSDA
jgi:signal transduction histidine kinase/CheY-like chemotaxis protein